MMKATMRMVIDASIACAAGESDYPTSSRSRRFLEKLRDESRHKVVVSQDIKKEWDRHPSRWFQRYRSSMVARKRVVNLPSPRDDSLRGRIMSAVEDAVRAQIFKDVHLVEAALVADRIVVSGDDKMRRHLSDLSISVGCLRNLVWVNPINELEAATNWLETCSYAERERCLGFWGSSPYNETAVTSHDG